METHAKRKPDEKPFAAAAHVLIFPGPAQGHVSSMLKLAELLALNILVTFLNTQHIHNCLIRFSDIQALSECYPSLQFKTISDFYSDDKHPGFGDRIGDVFVSMNLYAKPLLRDILVFGSLTSDLAAEFAIQNIHFRTAIACSFWAYFCVPKLFECNELPIRGDEDMDRIISNIPGMENLLRCRDLPSFCRKNKKLNLPLDTVVLWTQQSLEADALILNTFDDLEGPVLSQIRYHFPKLYTLGPLHHHLNSRKTKMIKPSFKSSFFEVDKSCMTWLDSQPLNQLYMLALEAPHL